MLLRIKPSHGVIYDKNKNLSIGEIPGLARVVTNAPAWLFELLNLLNGLRSLDEIFQILLSQGHPINRDIFNHAIKELRAAYVLENIENKSNTLTLEERKLYDRQMLYFSLVEKEGNPGDFYQEKLKQQHVMVFGAGGWGTWVAINLSLSGFGEITILDGDTVELSNLNRQVLYTHENLGMAKVEAARMNLKKINPTTKVNIINKFLKSNKEPLERIIPSNCTLIVLAWTNLSYFKENTVEEEIHNYAHRLKIPIIEIGADPLSASIGPLYVNDHASTCFRCVRSQIKDVYNSHSSSVQSLQETRLRDGRKNLGKQLNSYQSAPSLSVMGGLAVDQLVKFVTSCEKPLIIGKRYQFSLQTYEIQTEVYNCNTTCVQQIEVMYDMQHPVQNSSN